MGFFFFFSSFALGFFIVIWKKEGLSTSHWENSLFGVWWFLCLLEWKITHRHNTEKYYCQSFRDAVSLSIRSASAWSHGIFFLYFCFFVFSSSLLYPSSAILRTYNRRRNRICCHMLSQSYHPCQHVLHAGLLGCICQVAAVETWGCDIRL